VTDQDFAGDVEVIVADGGSTDGSVERLKAGAERGPGMIEPATLGIKRPAISQLEREIEARCVTRRRQPLQAQLFHTATRPFAWCLDQLNRARKRLFPLSHPAECART